MSGVERGVSPIWLRWARELQAIAQSGLTFTDDPYDRERYEAIRSLAARMMAEHSSADAAAIEDLFAGQTGYATPKVDVNQSPSESVIREVREESGLEVTARKLAAVYDRDRHPHLPPLPFHVFKLFFLCDIAGGAPAPGPETSEVAFFARGDIPADLSIGRVLRFQIERMFEHADSPDLPTDFD